VGAQRKHLQWVSDSLRDFDEFFVAIERAATSPIRYRWRPLDFRYFRSVGRTTPSAFVENGNFEVFYNVSGSLLKSHVTVRDTLFHEIFHVNETAHGEWATAALAPIVNGIAARCGTNNTCLAPYAPTDTKYGGGVYYAFNPGNGPLEVEYSAELASRYYEEQRATIAGERLRKPAFKCGPAENAQAWSLMVNEFFGGADVVPPCAR
jgi:hypothetical protein